MAERVRSVRQEQRLLAESLRGEQRTWSEVAQVFAERYRVNCRVGLRLSRGWSQREAADHWNARWPADPKTSKNFSYWENWPSATGHAPSLEVLARLAELYECRVADLVGDVGDYGHHDRVQLSRQLLPPVCAATGVDSFDVLAARLDEVEVQEIARLSSAWANETGGMIDRRALLLKVSAGLAVGASSPVVADAAPADAGGRARDGGEFEGVWHSRYTFFSTGRDTEFEGEHYLVLRQRGDRVSGQSLPSSLESMLHSTSSSTGW